MSFLHASTPRKILSFFFLACFFITPLLVPGNPDYLLPLLPECISVASLCCFVYLEILTHRSRSIEITGSEMLFFVGLFFLIFVYIFPRMLMSLSHTPHQVWNPCQNIAPSIFVRAECYLHGSIIQFPGPRQFYMSIAACIIGTLSFVAAGTSVRSSKSLLSFMALVSILYCVVVQIGIALGKDTILPEILGKSEFGKERFALIITNPGWVWPYLAPGLAVLIWFGLTKSSKIKQIFCSLGALVVAAGILQTRQRGGLLVVAALLSISGLYLVSNYLVRVPKSRMKIIVFFIFVLTAFSFLAPNVYEFIMTKMGRSTFIDTNRLAIWKIALPHVFQQKPFWGFGYASWFQEYRSVVTGKAAPLYDTAHNLFVQMLFEHGVIGSSLILTILFSILLLTVRNMRRNHLGLVMAAMAVITFICITAVQEIDYIRPTYYLHAFFWGTLVGYQSDSLNQKAPDTSDSRFLRKRIFIFSASKFKKGVLACGSAFILIGLCVAVYFPFGVYPFEGDLSKRSEKVERWVGPLSRINSYGLNNSWEFQLRFPQATNLRFANASIKCQFNIPAGGLKNIKNKNQQKWFPNSFILSSLNYQSDGSRYISARVVYPPNLVGIDEPTSFVDGVADEQCL